MKIFVKNWSLLSVSSLIQQLTSFFCMVRIARLLAPESFGDYLLILTAVSITTTIASLGLPQIITREVARRVSIPNIIKNIKSPLIMTVVVVNFGLGIYLYFFDGLSTMVVIATTVVLSIAQVLWLILESFAFGKQQMKFSSILGSLSSVIWVLYVFLIPVSIFSIEVMLSGFAMIQFLRSVAYISMEFQAGYFIELQNEHIRESKFIFVQSLPLYGTNLLALLTTQIPIIFLGQFSGALEVAYYGIGSKLMMPLMIMTNMLIAAVYPPFAKMYIENRVQFNLYVRKLFLVLAIGGIPLSLMLGLFSPEIIISVFGEKFSPAVEPFFIQVWIVLNIITLNFIANLFLASNQEKLMVKLSVFNGLFIGGCSYIGSNYGAIGLAIGSVVSFVAGFSLHWHFANKTFGNIFQGSFAVSIVILFLLSSIGGFFAMNASLSFRLVLLFGILGLLILVYKKQFTELFREVRWMLAS